jgi:CMP-N,N'-diacetyllegionaminic acid synthase
MALRVLAIIPARGGSKGISRKALRPLGGKPLIAHTIAAALASKLVDRTVFTTEDEEIAQVARDAGAEVPFMRPAELASDTAPMDGAIDHALAELARIDGYVPDAYAILQPTNPFRTASHIDGAICLMESSGAGSVVGVSEPTEHPAETVTFVDGKMRSMIDGIDLGSGVQRQGYPYCYFLNGALYLTRMDAYRTQGTRFATQVVPYVMDAIDGFDIDNPRDLALAQLIYENRERIRNAG